MERIIIPALTLLGIIAAILVAGFLIWLLYRWLTSKTAGQRNFKLKEVILVWFRRLKEFSNLWLGRLRALIKGYQSAAHYYQALKKWGASSGLAPAISETPGEYALRLGRAFPGIKKEVKLIVEGYYLEVYGETGLKEKDISLLHQAWKRLLSPRYYAARIKGSLLPWKGENKDSDNWDQLPD